MRLSRILVASIASAVLAGCDSNPGAPSFPPVPAGTKLPPASTAPEVE